MTEIREGLGDVTGGGCPGPSGHETVQNFWYNAKKGL